MKSLQEVLTKEYLTRLREMTIRLRYRLSTDGYSGARRSMAKGSSLEFSDYREYAPRHILRYRRTSGDIRPLCNVDRCYQIYVTAHKYMVCNGCSVFLFSIIINHNTATAEIDFFTCICISHIGQMRYFGAISDIGIFHFHKISNFYLFSDPRRRLELKTVM